MTDAELTILSLLSEGAKHGYQIQQAIEARGMREWTAIGFSSVYYILNKLEGDGLLSSKLTPSERGPARKVYALTQAGRNILQTAIADLLATPREFSSGFILGLANLHILKPEQVRHALDSYESSLRDRIADLNGRRAKRAAQHDELPLQVAALFDYQLQLMLAEVAWLREFRQAWEAQAPASLPERDALRAPVVRTPPVDLTPTPPASPTEHITREDVAAHKAETQAHAKPAAPQDEPVEAAADHPPDDDPDTLDGTTIILPKP